MGGKRSATERKFLMMTKKTPRRLQSVINDSKSKILIHKYFARVKEIQ